MPSEQNTEEKKQPYQKPKLRTIELAAEEVLAPGCKMAGGFAGVAGPDCIAGSCVASYGS